MKCQMTCLASLNGFCRITYTFSSPFPFIMSLPKSSHIWMDYYIASRNQRKSFLKMLSLSNLFNWVLLLYRRLWAGNSQWAHTGTVLCVLLCCEMCSSHCWEAHAGSWSHGAVLQVGGLLPSGLAAAPSRCVAPFLCQKPVLSDGSEAKRSRVRKCIVKFHQSALSLVLVLLP